MKRLILLTFSMLFAFSLSAQAEEIKKQPIGGAGPSTVIVELFVAELNQRPEANGYQFAVIPESSKHAGGIKHSDKFLFGRTGRPLKDEEKKLGKGEIFLAKIPIAFAVGTGVGIRALTLAQLESIYTRRITNWQELGGSDAPIELIGREPTEALFSVLKQEYPFFDDTTFDLVLKRDDQVVNFLKGEKGKYALGFGARPNLKEVSLVEVDGVTTGVRLGLVYDLKNENHPVVQGAMAYARSAEWAKIITAKTESLPPY